MHLPVCVYAYVHVQNMVVLDLKAYLRHKLTNPQNLQLMRNYDTNPDFALINGELWKHIDWEETDHIPEESAATQVRVCVCIHVHAYMGCIHTYTCDTYIHTYIHVHTHIHAMHTYIQTYMHVHTCYAYIHAMHTCDSYIHTYMHVRCIHIHTCTCDAYIHTCTCDAYMQPYIHTCMQVLPIWIQLHMDGVQVRRCLSHGAISALHINATPYNAGERLRRTASLRWRLGLLYQDWPTKLIARLFPKLGIIRGANQARAKARGAKAKRKRFYYNKLLYKKIADHMQEYREGFEFSDLDTGGCVHTRHGACMWIHGAQHMGHIGLSCTHHTS
jgi:hypothetical protein